MLGDTQHPTRKAPAMTSPTFGRPPAFDEVDPDLAEDAPTSELDDLRAELAADTTSQVELTIPGRPGWSATYSLSIRADQLDAYRRKAKSKAFLDGIDGSRFAAILLAATCTALTRRGAPVEVDGEPVTFASRALWPLAGAEGAAACVRSIYGSDGHMDAAARRVMADAGWGDEADIADPTE